MPVIKIKYIMNYQVKSNEKWTIKKLFVASVILNFYLNAETIYTLCECRLEFGPTYSSPRIVEITNTQNIINLLHLRYLQLESFQQLV